MSSIIKSENVSIGKTVAVEPDLPKVIKKSKPLVSSELKHENEIKKNVEKENTKTEVTEIITEEEKELALSRYVEEQKEKILMQCMEEARKKSELFFEEEMKKAYDEGIKNAEKEVQNMLEQANSQAEQIIQQAALIKQQATETYKNAFNTIEPEVVALSVDIAKKILNKEIEKDCEYILNIVKDAMDKISSKKDVVLKVSEKDYTIVIGNMDIMLAKVEGFGEIKVVKEASLDDGSCIVESEYGTIDGSLKTRMEQIEKEIERMINR